MDNCQVEATRKKFLVEHDNLAREVNVPLLEKILVLRDRVAKKLGYVNYADYETEVKMVKSGGHATKFLEDLKNGLQPKFAAEMEEFRQFKIKETGDTNAVINVWDWRYFSNQLKKEKYNVDAEQLRVYFPYQPVLDGMFAIYQRIFGLKFEPVTPPYKWIGDLQLYTVADAATGAAVTEATSDATGQYRIAGLSPGTYTVRAALDGELRAIERPRRSEQLRSVLRQRARSDRAAESIRSGRHRRAQPRRDPRQLPS